VERCFRIGLTIPTVSLRLGSQFFLSPVKKKKIADAISFSLHFVKSRRKLGVSILDEAGSHVFGLLIHPLPATT
jgi:hypothetical protein